MNAKWYIFAFIVGCWPFGTADYRKNNISDHRTHNNHSSTRNATYSNVTSAPSYNSTLKRPHTNHSSSNAKPTKNSDGSKSNQNDGSTFQLDALCSSLPVEGGLKDQCISCFNGSTVNPNKNSSDIHKCVQVLPTRFRTCLRQTQTKVDTQSILICIKNRIKNNNMKFQRKAVESISKLKQMFESIDMKIAMEVTTFSVFLEEVIQNSTRSLQLIRPHLINCLDSEVRRKRAVYSLQRYMTLHEDRCFTNISIKRDDQANATGLFDELYNQVRCQAEGILKSESAKEILMKKLENYDTPLPSFLFQMICLEEKRKKTKLPGKDN